MRRNPFCGNAAAVTALLAVISAAAAPLRAEVIDRVLAVAGGTVIMLSDIVTAQDLEVIAPEWTNFLPAAPGGDSFRATFNRLIDRALMLAEVERYAPPEPLPEAVDREVAALRSKVSRGAFEALLARGGIDESHLREIIRQDLRLRAYLNQRFAPAPPGDAELDRYLRDHTDRFSRNGVLPPLTEVRSMVSEALNEERRRPLVAEWVAGLRRRAEVIDVSEVR